MEQALQIGDKVQFKNHRGETIRGIIESIKQNGRVAVQTTFDRDDTPIPGSIYFMSVQDVVKR